MILSKTSYSLPVDQSEVHHPPPRSHQHCHHLELCLCVYLFPVGTPYYTTSSMVPKTGAVLLVACL